MLPEATILRISRPTDRLSEVATMYREGLGFKVLSEFQDHEGFDGVILGHPKDRYHLEFTHHRGISVGRSPTKDNLLVFYLLEQEEWDRACASMVTAGFALVPAYNQYWDRCGKTFEDLDGYRVVLQHGDWSK